MDFLTQLSQIANILLPVAGLFLLIVTSILVIRIIKVVKSANVVVDKGQTTIDQVNSTLAELQKPVQTVARISGGFDLVYSVSEKALKNFASKFADVLNYLTQMVKGGINKEEITVKEDHDERDSSK